MIKIVKGDLLEAKEHIIGQQVNCQGAMNSGVAKQIREKYIKAYTEYMELVKEHMVGEDLRKDLLGNVQFVRVANDKWIANLFGQFKYGYNGEQYTSTMDLFNCFTDLRANAEKHGLSVALPYMIGCYRGGADWKEVEDLLLTAFDGYEVTLYKKHMG